MKWRTLNPNEHGDWLNQRNDVFETFIPLAPEKKFDLKGQSFFITYGVGVNYRQGCLDLQLSKVAT